MRLLSTASKINRIQKSIKRVELKLEGLKYSKMTKNQLQKALICHQNRLATALTNNF